MKTVFLTLMSAFFMAVLIIGAAMLYIVPRVHAEERQVDLKCFNRCINDFSAEFCADKCSFMPPR